MDIKSETIGVISWNYCEVRWFYVLDGGLVARTLLGLDINGQQSTSLNLF